LTKKETIRNNSGLPLPLPELTLASGEAAEVSINDDVQRYLDTGAAVIETPKKGKE
jgi:hypothetical protein